MIQSESSNGAPTSKSGPSPEVVVVLSDRLDALERAIGTVRRRGMSLEVFSVSRQDDELVLTLRGDVGTTVPDRWLAELDTLVDVRQVKMAARD
jgi:acetolactate synthase regulatory subunit